MGGSSKSPSAPSVMPNYTDPVTGRAYSSPNDLNAAIAARETQDKATSDAAQAAKDAKAQADEQSFLTNKSNAINQTRTNIDSYFKGNGYDPNAYSNDIENYITTSASKIPDLDPSPINYFGDNAGAKVVGDLTANKQQHSLDTLNSLFGPNYVNTSLPDSLIDPAVSTAVSNQFDPLSTQLTNAEKRGQLTNVGYGAALKALDTARTGAQATVSGLARNVLSKDRQDLSGYITDAGNQAGRVTLGTNFDANAFLPEANSMVSRDTSNFGGDVTNAIGNTQFSDITSLLNAGGAVQGANNPTAANPVGAVGPTGGAIGSGGVNPDYIAQAVLMSQKRGLGNQGAF